MNLREFQEKSKRTINKDLSKRDQISNMVMGITGETGEVVDLLKKSLYQGHTLDTRDLVEEIGDTMFYWVNLCNLFDLDLEGILNLNYIKLSKRFPNGFESERSVNRG